MLRQDICKSQRVGVLVDVQNIYYAARNNFNAKVDFEKLLDTILQGRQLVRAIAYTVHADNGNGQSEFEQILWERGYEVKSKALLTRADGSSKGDWDMGIAMDAVAMSNKVDALCIVSGDSDFSELLRYLKRQGVRTEICSFQSSAGDELREVAGQFTQLTEKHML